MSGIFDERSLEVRVADRLEAAGDHSGELGPRHVGAKAVVALGRLANHRPGKGPLEIARDAPADVQVVRPVGQIGPKGDGLEGGLVLRFDGECGHTRRRSVRCGPHRGTVPPLPKTRTTGSGGSIGGYPLAKLVDPVEDHVDFGDSEPTLTGARNWLPQQERDQTAPRPGLLRYSTFRYSISALFCSVESPGKACPSFERPGSFVS